MLSTKIRITITTLVASAGVGVAALAPAASQAQWHNYCVNGHCTTHQNFTIGGKSPCEVIQGSYNTAYDGLLNAIDEKPLSIGGPSPAEAEQERAKEIAEAEARVREAEREAFTWGCQLALKASPTHQRTSPVQGAMVVSADAGTVSKLTQLNHHRRVSRSPKHARLRRPKHARQ